MLTLPITVTGKFAAGIKMFQKEKFELYKDENELKLYTVNGCMSPAYYKNLVILALSLKEYKWIKEFILNYKNELPADIRGNVYMYCMALYEFDMKEFEKSLELLSKIKSLISSLEAFRHFLSNNKLLPENKKVSYSNFYKFFNKVVSYNIKKDKIELENLKMKISGNITVFNKHWIIEKINKLISN